MWRSITGLSGIAMAGLAVGMAASLTMVADSLAARELNVPRCTTAGLGVIQNLSGSNVISVTVSNLPSSCGGATIDVTLNNLITNSSGSNTVPGGGGSVTVTLASAIAATTTEQIDLILTGP